MPSMMELRKGLKQMKVSAMQSQRFFISLTLADTEPEYDFKIETLS